MFGLAGAVTAQVLAFALLIGGIAIPGAFLAKAFVERMPAHIHTAILDAAVIAGGVVMISAAPSSFLRRTRYCLLNRASLTIDRAAVVAPSCAQFLCEALPSFRFTRRRLWRIRLAQLVEGLLDRELDPGHGHPRFLAPTGYGPNICSQTELLLDRS